MPKISIIVPIYNTSEYIEKCIESIKNQTFKNFEVICVNDGSTDNSADICKSIISGFPNFILISKENGGLSSARLYGLKHALGEYVTFIDSDDYLEPNYLKRLYFAISSTGADISMCSYYTVRNEVKSSHKLYFNNKETIISKKDILNKYTLPQLPDPNRRFHFLPAFMWLRLIKRSILSDDMFISEREVYLEDMVFSVKVFKHIEKVAIINEPLYNYCVRSGSLTLKYRKNLFEMTSNLYKEINNELAGFKNETIDYHLNSILLFSVLLILRNAAHKNFVEFNAEFERVRSNQKINKAIVSTSYKGLYRSYVILLLLLRFKLPYILYIYNKKRI